MPTSPKLLTTLVLATLLVLAGSVIALLLASATADRSGRVTTDLPLGPAVSQPALQAL